MRLDGGKNQENKITFEKLMKVTLTQGENNCLKHGKETLCNHQKNYEIT